MQQLTLDCSLVQGVQERAGFPSCTSGEVHPMAQKTRVCYIPITERMREIQPFLLNHCTRREGGMGYLSQLEKRFQEHFEI